MSTNNDMVRKNFILPDALWDLVEEFRWDHRHKSETEAVVALLKKGLGVEGDQYDPKPRGRPKSEGE
jgi:hypothetical protein